MNLVFLIGGLTAAAAGYGILRKLDDSDEGSGFRGVFPGGRGIGILCGYLLLGGGLFTGLIFGFKLIYG